MATPDAGDSRAPRAGLRPQADIPNWVWIAPAIALGIGLLPLPYAYYMGLRWLVAGCAAFLAWKEYVRNDRQPNSYVWIFGAVAVIYNPIIQIHLFQLFWIVINIATAATFVGHYKLCLPGKTSNAGG